MTPNLRMCNWQVAVPAVESSCPADAFATVVGEFDRYLARIDQLLVDNIEHLQRWRLCPYDGPRR